MPRRKHISWKTRCAAALLDGCLVRERFGLAPRRWYDDAKKMTEDQFLSLFQFDHNMLHAFGDENRDAFWNFTPRAIREHREKTKRDAKIIAKSKRIRRHGHSLVFNPEAARDLRESPVKVMAEVFHEGVVEGREETNKKWIEEANRPGGAVRWVRKIHSRGFDKTLRKKVDGTVLKRGSV